MRYQQITPAERYTFAVLRKQGCSDAEIARITGRHRSTIGRAGCRRLRQRCRELRPRTQRGWTPPHIGRA